MNAEQNELGLSLPSRRAPDADAFDTSPRKLRAWINALPMANIRQAARMAFDALKNVNATELGPAERLAFLESLRKPLQQITETLEDRYVGKAFPLSPKDCGVAEAVRTFHAEMAVGYKIAAADFAEAMGLTAKLTRIRLVLAVHRALLYLGRVLLDAYLIYAPPPSGVWREINALYEFAVRRGIDNTAVEDQESLLARKTTIEDLYKQLLLLGVANPHRLPQEGVAAVRKALEKWASHAALVERHDAANIREGAFKISPDMDTPPEHIDLGTPQASGRVLDVRALGTVLREQFDLLIRAGSNGREGATKDLPPGVTPELLYRLMKSWGVARKRRFMRAPKDRREQTIEIILGFSAIRRALAKKAEATEDKADEIELVADDSDGFMTHTEDTGDHTHSLARCIVRDESPTGYRLQWQSGEDGTAHVGELLGALRIDASNREHWALGVIRWMHFAKESGLEFGIELLAPDVCVGQIHAATEKGGHGRPEPVLLLPSRTLTGRPETLIGPTFLTEYPDDVVMQARDESRPITLTKVVEITNSFVELEFADRSPDKAEQDAAGKSQEDELESVFASL